MMKNHNKFAKEEPRKEMEGSMQATVDPDRGVVLLRATTDFELKYLKPLHSLHFSMEVMKELRSMSKGRKK